MRSLEHLVGPQRSERPDLPLAIAAYPGDIGVYYGHTLAEGTKIFAARGTAAAPVTEGAAPIVAILHSSDPTADGLENQAAIYGAAYKYVTGAQTRVQGGLFEAIDEVGGSDSFIEGMRSTAFLHAGTLGSAYGAVHLAQALPGTNPKYVVGLECDVLRDENSDAPVAASFDQTKFVAAFLASSTIASADKPDVAFLVNPLTAVPFRTGFLVAQTSVDNTAFASRAATVLGLDLSLGSQSVAAILIPNNTAISGKNAAGSANLNVLFVNASNELVLSADTSRVLISHNFTSGVAGLQVTTTQTAPNAADTGDGVASFVYTLSAASATNELIARVFKLVATNTLTGGGALTNARIFNLVGVSSAGSTTTNMDGIYIEQAGAAGTVTIGAAIRIASWLGTTKWGIADDSGGNWYNTGGLSVGTTTAPGATGQIRINNAAFMLRNSTAFTNGAGAGAGTITNAPAAGNPTKWIAIDDNGTTRQIPAW